MATRSVQFAVRLEPGHIALIDEVVAALADRGLALDVTPTRAAVMRTALVRGLTAMKAELASSKPRKRK
jgi:hypothetical protein